MPSAAERRHGSPVGFALVGAAQRAFQFAVLETTVLDEGCGSCSQPRVPSEVQENCRLSISLGPCRTDDGKQMKLLFDRSRYAFEVRPLRGTQHEPLRITSARFAPRPRSTRPYCLAIGVFMAFLPQPLHRFCDSAGFS